MTPVTACANSYPPVAFYRAVRSGVPGGNIRLSAGTCFSPVSQAYREIIRTMVLEDFVVKMGEYGDIGGHSIPRKLAADLENQRNRCDYYDTNNAFLTLGTTEGIDLVVTALKLDFDVPCLACPLPVYFTVGMSAHSYGVDVLHIPPFSGHFRDIDIQPLRDLPEDSIMYVNNPNAMTGTFLDPDRLRELFEIVRERSLYCIYDEIVRESVWGGSGVPTPIATAAEAGILDRFFFVHGPSKDKSLAGARIGYLLCPRWYKRRISDLITHRSFCHPVVLSHLAIMDILISRAYFHVEPDPSLQIDSLSQVPKLHRMHSEHVARLIEGYRTNADTCLAALGDLVEWHEAPAAGYSMFLKVRQADRIDQGGLTRRLSEQHGVDIAPGPMFGGTQAAWEERYGLWIRVNLSLSAALFEEGCRRLARGLNGALGGCSD